MKDTKPSKEHFYLTETGERMPIRPVSLLDLQLAEQGLREEYVARGEPLSPPVYRVDLAGGGVQEFPHDATTARTDEEKEAWAKHIDAVNRFEAERGRVIQEIVFEDGIAVEIPSDGAWEKKMARRHVAVSSDLDEKRTQYILSVYLKTPQDIKSAIAEIMLLSAKGHDNQKEIEAALAGFLGDVPGAGDGGGAAAG